jgi:hypothetical protein
MGLPSMASMQLLLGQQSKEEDYEGLAMRVRWEKYEMYPLFGGETSCKTVNTMLKGSYRK